MEDQFVDDYSVIMSWSRLQGVPKEEMPTIKNTELSCTARRPFEGS